MASEMIEEFIDEEMKSAIAEIMPLVVEQSVASKHCFSVSVTACKIAKVGRSLGFYLTCAGFEVQLGLLEDCYEIRAYLTKDLLEAGVDTEYALFTAVYEHSGLKRFGVEHKRTMVQRLSAAAHAHFPGQQNQN